MSYGYEVLVEDVEDEGISYSKLVEQLESENYRNQINPERKYQKYMKRLKKYTTAPDDKNRNKVAWNKLKEKYRNLKAKENFK